MSLQQYIENKQNDSSDKSIKNKNKICSNKIKKEILVNIKEYMRIVLQHIKW